MPVRPLDEEAVFEVAVELESPEARAEYLRQVCGDDRAQPNGPGGISRWFGPQWAR